MENDNETVKDVCDEMYCIESDELGYVTLLYSDFIGYANHIEAAYRREVEELRECLRTIRDNLVLHTIRSADGKYVNNGAFLSEEFVDDERWRKALEGEKDGN